MMVTEQSDWATQGLDEFSNGLAEDKLRLRENHRRYGHLGASFGFIFFCHLAEEDVELVKQLLSGQLLTPQLGYLFFGISSHALGPAIELVNHLLEFLNPNRKLIDLLIRGVVQAVVLG
jgi:hypothetical protein